MGQSSRGWRNRSAGPRTRSGHRPDKLRGVHLLTGDGRFDRPGDSKNWAMIGRLLNAGFFDGNLGRLGDIKKGFDRAVARRRESFA
jgi:hypothetical protein